MMQRVLWLGALSAIVFMLGCDRGEPARSTANTGGRDAAQGSAPTDSGLPAGLLAEEEPDGAVPLADVKSDSGREGLVVVRGRIGGREEPFVLGRAAFTFADLSLVPCNERHGDACPTPWDYCCEPREDIVAKSATIQVVDESGRPLRIDLQKAAGLKPLAELVVAGRIADRSEGVLVINAERIYIVK